jgi:hypothetical protein
MGRVEQASTSQAWLERPDWIAVCQVSPTACLRPFLELWLSEWGSEYCQQAKLEASFSSAMNTWANRCATRRLIVIPIVP